MIVFAKKTEIICSLILRLLCFVENSSANCPFKLLNLEKGDNCREDQNYVCMESSDCKTLRNSIDSNNYPEICKFNGKIPIICCPPAISVSSDTKRVPPSTKRQSGQIAVEKCRKYNGLDLPEEEDLFDIFVVGGKKALPGEFPHMALIGYGETTEDKFDWKCGGSLISERWILTAAHCYQDGNGVLAKWVRLGELDILSDTDDAEPVDYSIIERVIHPDYTKTSHYNDIALLRLDSDVKISKFATPLCLNTDHSLNPTSFVATGWGKTATDEGFSDTLMHVTLNHVPGDTCNSVYSKNSSSKLKSGIPSDSMVCAGSTAEDEDTCEGDSGGPLQVKQKHGSQPYFTQFGITSFGSGVCGDGKPGVYTRVSAFIPWIEKIVWPDE